MGILIDFEEAKARLIAPTARSADAGTTTSLTDAVASFALSQMPKRNRVALVLAGIFGGEAEQHLEQADEVLFYAATDFTVPYKAPAKFSDVVMGDILG